MIRYIWLQDEIDWGEVNNCYKNINVIRKGDRIVSLEGEYILFPVRVNFYTKEQANNHLKYHLWCGMEVQKVVCFEDIKLDSARYLITRLRSENRPYFGGDYTPKEVVCVMETTGKYPLRLRDWEDNIFAFKGDKQTGLLLESLQEFF